MKLDLEFVEHYTRDLSILYVEDDESIREAFEETLAMLCHKVVTAENGRLGLEAYRRFRQESGEFFDIVITDIRMPECNGIEMSRKLLEEHPEQEIVILSAHDNSDGLIRMINLGINHFILKPVQAEQLLGTLYRIGEKISSAREKREMLESIQLLNQELKQKVEELEKLANEDPLTEIPNRRRFFKESERLLTHCRKSEDIFFLFVIDIDEFKKINDTYGHAVGDGAIRLFVETVKKRINRATCFSRLGGDEFIIILHGCSREEALEKIESIRRDIDRPRMIHERELHFTISIGMATLQPDDRVIDDVIRRADEKLYEAKKLGRNITVV